MFIVIYVITLFLYLTVYKFLMKEYSGNFLDLNCGFLKLEMGILLVLGIDKN